MDLTTGQDAPPAEADWLRLAEQVEQAQTLDDPLKSLELLTEAEDEAHSLAARVVEHAVRYARSAGKTWAEIAAATGVKDRQAAWRRWTDRGIR